MFDMSQKELGLPVFELEGLVDTRWSYWYSSLQKIVLCINYIADTLNCLRNQQSDKVSSSEAQGLYTEVISIEFIAILYAMEKVLGKVDYLSKELQNPKLNIQSACSLIESVEKSL